ncbi:MAG: hypothetical protein ACT4PZ_15065 [Panacagrimonas sp.]
MAGAPCYLSRFTSARTLSKAFALAPDGTLSKTTAANLVDGTYAREEVNDLQGLDELLATLKPTEALAYGVAPVAKARVVASSVSKDKRPPGAITRTRDTFGWPDGPGILMLDYDPEPGRPPLTHDELFAALYKAAPSLAGVSCLWLPSAGSCIYNAVTGAELRGVHGQRVYFIVEQAAEIPDIGKRLTRLLWMSGCGRFDVSKAGTLLSRTLVDSSVWQPERLDFAAGARCSPPLEQRRGAAVLRPGRPMLKAADLPAVADANLKPLQAAARAAVADKARDVRAAYLDERVGELTARRKIAPELAREIVTRALDGSHLLAEFELTHSSGERVTVGDVLDNADRWHNEHFADPVEPDYRDDMRIAWANLCGGGRPYLWSHAHGGRRFLLFRQTRTIQLQSGEMPRISDECASILAAGGETYSRGGALMSLRDASLVPASLHSLLYALGSEVRFTKYDARSKEWRPADAPEALAKMLLATLGNGRIPEVRAVITVPLIFPDGRILDSPATTQNRNCSTSPTIRSRRACPVHPHPQGRWRRLSDYGRRSDRSPSWTTLRALCTLARRCRRSRAPPCRLPPVCSTTRPRPAAAKRCSRVALRLWRRIWSLRRLRPRPRMTRCANGYSRCCLAALRLRFSTTLSVTLSPRPCANS